MLKLAIIASSFLLFSCGQSQVTPTKRGTATQQTNNTDTSKTENASGDRAFENLFAGGGPGDELLRGTLDAEIANIGAEDISVTSSMIKISIEDTKNSCTLDIEEGSREAVCDRLFYNTGCLQVISTYVYYFGCQGGPKDVEVVLFEALDSRY